MWINYYSLPKKQAMWRSLSHWKILHMCVPSENHEPDQTLTVRKLPDLVQASRFELPQANSKCPKNSRVLQQIGLLQDNQPTPLLLLWIWLCISRILCWEKSKDSRPGVSSLERWRRRRGDFLVWSWGSQSLSIFGRLGAKTNLKKNKKTWRRSCCWAWEKT